MPVSLTVNGVAYSYPQTGDSAWGSATTSWAQAVTAGMLQKAGGAFTLTAEADFGATYGIKSAYYKSQGTNLASAGILRLANNEELDWRNAANSANLALKVDASDKLSFGGQAVSAAEFGYLAGVTSAIQTQIGTKLTNPMTANGDLITRVAGAPAAVAIGTEGQLLRATSGGQPAWATISTPAVTESTLASNFSVTQLFIDTPGGNLAQVSTVQSVITTVANEIVEVAYNGSISLNAATDGCIVGYQVDSATPVCIHYLTYAGSAVNMNAGFCIKTAALSAGSHTIKLMAAKTTGTVTFAGVCNSSISSLQVTRFTAV